MTEEERQARKLKHLLGLTEKEGLVPLFTHFHRTKTNKNLKKKKNAREEEKILGGTACVLLRRDTLEVLSRGFVSVYAYAMPSKVTGRLLALKRAFGPAVSNKGYPKNADVRKTKNLVPGFDKVPIIAIGEVAEVYLTDFEKKQIASMRDMVLKKEAAA